VALVICNWMALIAGISLLVWYGVFN
jgi:hypothetical protein